MSKVKILSTTPTTRVLAEPVTLKLTEATFSEVSAILAKGSFHVQNPEDSCRKCDSLEAFNYWKEQTLSKYPNAVLIITKGAYWFDEVRVSDEFFQTDKTNYSNAKISFLENTPKY